MSGLKIMFAANGDIGIVSTDLDLLSIIDRFTRLGTQDHGRLAGTVLADGFDLPRSCRLTRGGVWNLQRVHFEIIFEAKSHDRHIQFINDSCQVIDMVAFQKIELHRLTHSKV